MAFNHEETQGRVLAIIEEKLGRPRGSVQSSDTFESIGADSLDLVELVMTFEVEFGVEIKDEHFEQVQSVGEMIAYIQKMRTK